MIMGVTGLAFEPRATLLIGQLGYYSNGRSIYIGKKTLFLNKQVHTKAKRPPGGLIYYVYYTDNILLSIEPEIEQ